MNVTLFLGLFSLILLIVVFYQRVIIRSLTARNKKYEKRFIKAYNNTTDDLYEFLIKNKANNIITKEEQYIINGICLKLEELKSLQNGTRNRRSI